MAIDRRYFLELVGRPCPADQPAMASISRKLGFSAEQTANRNDM
jgi:hypothetical protein